MMATEARTCPECGQSVKWPTDHLPTCDHHPDSPDQRPGSAENQEQ
jgi:endogenous inhibitor of DNA gyrase (YacG/DUF329 family)